jgi:molybdopterin-guanine dinucleotide biosynthesis protein A
MRSAIILAGGSSRRLGYDKGLRLIAGKRLVAYAIDALQPIVEEVLLVVGSEAQREYYMENLPSSVKVLVDRYYGGSPLIGLITGLAEADSEYAFVTACDMPFITREPVELLFGKARDRNGAAFIKPDGWIEPLFAVYRVATCLPEAIRLFRAGDLRIRMVLRNLRDVEYVSLSALDADPELLFFDTDTEEKLAFAEKTIKENTSL